MAERVALSRRLMIGRPNNRRSRIPRAESCRSAGIRSAARQRPRKKEKCSNFLWGPGKKLKLLSFFQRAAPSPYFVVFPFRRRFACCRRPGNVVRCSGVPLIFHDVTISQLAAYDVPTFFLFLDRCSPYRPVVRSVKAEAADHCAVSGAGDGFRMRCRC